MNDILKTYMERFRENRHALRRYTAFVLALAMITTLFVNWQLHCVGISMTAQYQCGEEEHAHTADCYTKVLICGYEEGELENASEVAAAEAAAASQPSAEEEIMPLELEPQIEFVPHEHTDDCYTAVQTLTCMEEEHVHDDDCYDPEDGSLICDKFEHTHDESCYTTEYELTCGLEEGELVEQVVEPTQTAELVAMAVAEPVALEPVVNTVEPIYHHHTDACYEEVLTCPLPEHHHTVACLSDTTATETPEEWQASTAGFEMTGDWNEDLLSVAKTQLGYEQSEKNFEIDPADGVTLRYYTRYGDSYNNPYGEWDVMFLSYCLKYAEIPQSAIPQEASVLALRSAMAGMDWLLDGEDGSAADVGDIVIYNKYVTRTVAVDSSADSAADDLDDLFSVDAEGENGAEPEDSGAAAEDTTALDTPDIPDLPDTVDPEQPAVLSVASTAAEPQTTTVTDAESVETVGIVSEADEDTLTVISGDVDGKVAEVTLSNADVVGVISVAYAQYADEMLSSAVDGALYSPMMLAVTGEPTTVSTSTTYLDYFNETKKDQNGGITKYTFKINEEEKPGDFSVTVNQKVFFYFDYTIAANVLKEGSNKLTYQLPKELCPKEHSTPILNDAGKKVGTQYFYTNGTTVLEFDLASKDFDATQPFKGHFSYEWQYQEENATTEKKIQFPGSSTTITLEKLEDIDIKKSQPSVNDGTITETADGKTKLSYTVTVSSKNGWSENIHIWDGLKPDGNFTSADYDTTSFKLYKVKSNGDREEITKFTPDFTTKDKKYGKDFTKTFQINDLPALDANEKYVLTYDVLTTRTGSATLNNTAKTNNSKEDKREVTLDGNILWKDGSYDKDNNCINWTVTVNNPSALDLTNYTVTDTLDGGATIIGDVTLTLTQDSNGNWPKTQIDTIKNANGQSGFIYNFSNLTNKDNRSAKQYVFTYKSTVPEGSTSVKNKVDYGYGNRFTTEKEVPIPGSGSGSGSGSTEITITPKKTASGKLTPISTGNPYLLTAPWTITADIPGKGVYKFSDRITNSSGWFNGKEVIYHYGIAKELQQQLEDNLTITYVENGDTKTLRFSDLDNNKGISFAVKYYQYDWSGSPVEASDNSTPVRAFEVTLDTTKCKLELQKLTLNYSTRVDGTDLPEGTRVTIKNQINYDNSVKYEYQKPSSELKMTKGVRLRSSLNETAENYGRCDSPSASSSGTLDKSYAELKDNLLEYQVLLDFSSADSLPPTITLTDTLPKGLTYFTYNDNPSASIVFINGYGNKSKYKDLPLTAGGTTDFKEYFRTAGRLVVTEPTEGSEDGQTLTFNITGLDKIDFAKLKAEGYTELVLRYRAQLTDTRWSSLRFDTFTYTNKVKWKEQSELEDEVSVKVNQTSKVLTKDSIQLKDKGDSRVKYTLIINPAAKNLNESGNTITLTDVLTVKNKNVQASLDIFSVHLYNTETNAEVPLSGYSYLQPVQSKNDKDYPVYTTTFTLPDETPLKLVYEYVTTASGAIDLDNTAEVTGSEGVTKKTSLESVGSYSGVSQASLTVYKVDKRNYSITLTGASFTLDSFNSTDGTWTTVRNEAAVDNNGTLTFHFEGNEPLSANTLYRLTEKTAPTGYSKASAPYYFIYQDSSSDRTAAYNAAVGTTHNNDEGIPTSDAANLLYCANNKPSELFVPNTANSLTIIKKWRAQDGSWMKGTDVNMDTVDVQLYCYEKDADISTAVKYGDVFQLTKQKDWTTTVDIDATHLEGYIFYIKETNVNKSRFTVVYDQPAGVEVGSTLTFTNTDTGFSSYELPSTGGTGTLPYTAVGGTMMLTALAYSIIHRKRRREGRADD